MNRFDCVIWDLDGCLLDSRPGIIEAMKLTLDHFEIAYNEEDLIHTIGVSWAEVFMANYGVKEKQLDEVISFCRTKYIKEGRMMNAILYEGVEKLLQNLKEKNHRLYVASAKPKAHADTILRGHGLLDYFDAIHGAELVGSMTKIDLIKVILDDMQGVEPARVVMIEDRAKGIEAAKSCGIVTVGVRHGYAEAGELEGSSADYIVDGIPGVRKILIA